MIVYNEIIISYVQELIIIPIYELSSQENVMLGYKGNGIVLHVRNTQFAENINPLYY